jgi:urease accessory protein
LLLWDAVASGRVARGERWACTSFENEILIETVSHGSVLERYQLNPSANGVGLAAGWNYVGALFLIGDGINGGKWKQIEANIEEILDARPGAVLGGVSEPAAPGLAVKLVAKSAPDMSEMLDDLWQVIRLALWSLPKPALRRY